MKLIQEKEVKIVQVLLYNCKESVKDDNDGIRICILFNDNTIGIFTKNPKKLQKISFDDAKVERIWKNTASRGSGIICQYSPASRKLIYLTNKYLRKPELNNIKPYVILLY